MEILFIIITNVSLSSYTLVVYDVSLFVGYFVCLSCKKNGSWSNFIDNADSLLSTDKG